MLFRAGSRRRLIPSWFWILVVSVPLIYLLRWLIWVFFIPRNEGTSALEIDAPRSDSIPMKITKDDFSVLKGVGPKTSETLHAAGIFTFEQLGLFDPDELIEVLQKSSLPTTSAAFWQDQASLAAAGDWDALKKMQQ